MSENPKPQFAGDKKEPLRSPLARMERAFIDANVARFPPWIEGHHLTWLTALWTAIILLSGWLAAAENIRWLWLSSLMLFFQWFTDCFDGALGRHRNRGLIKWGFYVDHLLDYLFMSAVFLQYLPLLSGHFAYMLLGWTFAYGAMMVSSWLSFAATNRFKITYLGMGPTEIRLLFIIINTLIILRGPWILSAILPYALGISIVLGCFIIWRTQREMWALDMQMKKEKSADPPKRHDYI